MIIFALVVSFGWIQRNFPFCGCKMSSNSNKLTQIFFLDAQWNVCSLVCVFFISSHDNAKHKSLFTPSSAAWNSDAKKVKDTMNDEKFCRFVRFNNNKSFRKSFVIRFKMLGKGLSSHNRKTL